MEGKTQFKYLGSILCQHESMDRGIRESTLQGRIITAYNERKYSKNGSKKALLDSINVLIVAFTSKTLTRDKSQRSKVSNMYY